MMGLLRALLFAVLLWSALPVGVSGQAAPAPGAPAPGGAHGPGATHANTDAPPVTPVPQVVPTPPTQQAGPGSPAGTPGPDTRPAPDDAIPAPPSPPAGWTRQTFTVAPCAAAPVIDGRLDDACWKTATHARGFYRYGGGTASAQQTEAWICADKTHLYFAFRCLDSHPESISAGMTQRNGNLGRDDFVGVDIDSQGTRRGDSTFIANARGTQFEILEGGTADNITWAGDWKAAARRTGRGWTCEMSIPFALMRYPRGSKSFGMVLSRQIGRETSLQSWPYVPPAGVGNGAEPQYMDTFAGIAPPFYTPRPTFLPYTLATAGTGSSVREGMDIKYPLSTTLTGVATLFPDFQTIEQDVTNIDFSYTEKLLTDRRPFFAEGADYLPYQDLFYSRRINALDGGLKVVGKQENTTVGLLTTGTRGVDAQSAAVLNVKQEIGLYSSVLVDAVDDVQKGGPSNQTGKLEGIYGWKAGPTTYTVQADHIPSFTDQRHRGDKEYFQISSQPLMGHPRLSVSYEDTSPDFVSNLGFNPELDYKGGGANASQFNQFDRGWIENYAAGGGVSSFQHHTGGFFHNDLYTFASILTRKGLSCEIDTDISRRNQVDGDTDVLDRFHDHTLTPQLGWGQKTLYQQGSLSDAFGRQGGQSYNFLSAGQGILISRPFSVQLNFSRLGLGGAHSTQAIATGTYRLNEYRTIGARIVNLAGKDQGGGLGTDIYFSFSQQVRAGTDVFLLFGDPNSPRTRGKFTLKLVRPF